MFWENLPVEQTHLLDVFKQYRRPFSASVELTRRCNNNCIHCYNNKPASDPSSLKREMSIKELESFVEQAVELDMLHVLLTGGEPLLRKDFQDIYMLFKRAGMLVSIFTNGIALTPSLIGFLEQYPPALVELTVYGLTEETYESVTRVKGSFKRFMQAVRLLDKSKIKVNYKAVFLEQNKHEFDEIHSFCNERSAIGYRFDIMVHNRTDFDSSRNNEIAKSKLNPSDALELEKRDPKRSRSMEKYYDRVASYDLDPESDDRLFTCGAGSKSIYVSADGIVHPCGSLMSERFSFSLREHRLETIWNELIPASLDVRAPKDYPCLTCSHRFMCDWCPAHADLDSGDLTSISEHTCEMTRLRMETLRIRRDSHST
ncbi:radical SAM protein [bacterium]|nr:radical SAM protein [bacterium]